MRLDRGAGVISTGKAEAWKAAFRGKGRPPKGEKSFRLLSLGRRQNMPRTVTFVERYHRFFCHGRAGEACSWFFITRKEKRKRT